MTLDKGWISIKNRASVAYVKGVDGFLEFALSNVPGGLKDTTSIRCPCEKCRNTVYKTIVHVRCDLLKWGIYENYSVWDLHGEKLNDISSDENDAIDADAGYVDVDVEFEMLQDACGVADMLNDDESIPEEANADAKKFYALLREYRQALTTNGTTMSTLSYLVKLLHLKVLNHWSDRSFDSLLKLQRQAWGTSLPESYYEAKKLIKTLGLDYEKIDACENDCVLYWKEYALLDECPTCGLSRWRKDDKGSSKGVKVPHKVLRYFPLKSRLQRLYMSRKMAKDMQWHQAERVESAKMTHPADSVAWKSFDKEYPTFAEDARNVRLGLACDGFQPFNNTQHSIWPVVLIPYNLPPWLCMKPHSFMLTLLIPGPTSPGKNLDVYLRPLVDELKELWEVGIETYDAYSKNNFIMRAMVLWTINDFPAYADLSGWLTKGKFACPCCHKHTKRTSLKHKGGYLGHRRWLPRCHPWRRDASSFDNTKENGSAPVPLSGDDVLSHFNRFTQEKYGKLAGTKRKRDSEVPTRLYGWYKKSIFFELPYWSKLKIRHNLDVMHIEKNVSDNILGTLMGIKGKNKDTLKARVDLMKMKIRKELHLIVDRNKLRVPVACYSLSAIAKAAICNMFSTMKSPDGYMSNLSRCVKDNGKKISGMKSHDHHVFMEQLLPLAVRGFLPKHVCEPLIELSSYFQNLCSKSISIAELESLERDIPYTLCKLEMVFPPAFFDVMVHLVVHLASEAMIAGPVRFRWMFLVERYIGTLKAYIRNRGHPEGSIAEGYLADECLTFCSIYMNDIDTKFSRKGRNTDDSDEGGLKSNIDIFKPLGSPLGKGVPLHLSSEECEQIHLYILHNCDDLVEFVKQHKLELEQECPSNVERRHKAQFSNWIHDHVRTLYNDGGVDVDLYNLVCASSNLVRRYDGYIVNGFRFHTTQRSANRKTQHSGVLVHGDGSSDLKYYGVLRDIFELNYPGGNNVVVFKCDWFDVGHLGAGYKVDDYGITSVNKLRSFKSDEVIVLQSQVQQVFYIDDPRNDNWQFVIQSLPRDLYDMPSVDGENEPVDVDAYQQEEVNDVEAASLLPRHDNFSIGGSLATNAFVFEREAKSVDMVKKVIEETTEHDDFIDDGEIQVSASSSEEEELQSDDSE